MMSVMVPAPASSSAIVERDTLGSLPDPDDDELTGLAGARHARRADDHAVELGGDLFVADDLEHVDLVVEVIDRTPAPACV